MSTCLPPHSAFLVPQLLSETPDSTYWTHCGLRAQMIDAHVLRTCVHELEPILAGG